MVFLSTASGIIMPYSAKAVCHSAPRLNELGLTEWFAECERSMPLHGTFLQELTLLALEWAGHRLHQTLPPVLMISCSPVSSMG